MKKNRACILSDLQTAGQSWCGICVNVCLSVLESYRNCRPSNARLRKEFDYPSSPPVGARCWCPYLLTWYSPSPFWLCVQLIWRLQRTYCHEVCEVRAYDVFVKKRSGHICLGIQPHTHAHAVLPKAPGLAQQCGANKCVTIWRDFPLTSLLSPTFYLSSFSTNTTVHFVYNSVSPQHSTAAGQCWS